MHRKVGIPFDVDVRIDIQLPRWRTRWGPRMDSRISRPSRRRPLLYRSVTTPAHPSIPTAGTMAPEPAPTAQRPESGRRQRSTTSKRCAFLALVSKRVASKFTHDSERPRTLIGSVRLMNGINRPRGLSTRACRLELKGEGCERSCQLGIESEGCCSCSAELIDIQDSVSSQQRG